MVVIGMICFIETFTKIPSIPSQDRPELTPQLGVEQSHKLRAALVYESVCLISVLRTGAPTRGPRTQGLPLPDPPRLPSVTERPRGPPHVDPARRIKVCLLAGGGLREAAAPEQKPRHAWGTPPASPCPSPSCCTRPAPPSLPHDAHRCTRPRPPAHARLLKGKAPPPICWRCDTAPSRPAEPPSNSERGWAGRDSCREGVLANGEACRAWWAGRRGLVTFGSV